MIERQQIAFTKRLSGRGDLPPRPFVPAALRRPPSPANRRRAIDDLAILDMQPDPQFDAIVDLAAALCRTRMSAITVLTEDQQWFKAWRGFDAGVMPIDQAFCRHALGLDQPYVVRDAAVDAAFADNPLVTAAPNIRFYAGMPIHAPDGTAIGTLCVFDSDARHDGLDPLERQALETLAGQVEMQLQLCSLINDQQKRIDRQQQMSRHLLHAAEHDGLTGLLNRKAFIDRAAPVSGRSAAALLIVDIDGFKQVNEVWSQEAGDAVLRHVAEHLHHIAGDLAVARLGDDEFAVLLTGEETHKDPDVLAAQLSVAISRLVPIAGRMIGCSVCVGYARGGPGMTFPEFAKHADLALSDAKRNGPGTIRAFRPDLERTFRRDLAALRCARQAVVEDRLVPHYQPKLDLQHGALTGVEALLRWRDSDGVLRLPNEIDAAFRDHELALAIGHGITVKVLDDIVRWRDAGIDIGHVGINTTTADFAADDFAERLIDLLARRNIPPRMIDVEVTEEVVLGGVRPQVERALKLCREAGMSVALDDFGTGHAALTDLKTLPITSLKIDRSFVADLGSSAADNAIVAALAMIGQRMDLTVVAEGVETVDQVSRLIELGVNQAQGFYFSRPLDAEAMTAFASRSDLRVQAHSSGA